MDRSGNESVVNSPDSHQPLIVGAPVIGGVIDMGTNTFLLLVAQLDRQGRIATPAYEQRAPEARKRCDFGGSTRPQNDHVAI